MPLSDADARDPQPERDEPEDAREAWLSLALADPDGGAAALATAARGGRPLPRRDA